MRTQIPELVVPASRLRELATKVARHMAGWIGLLGQRLRRESSSTWPDRAQGPTGRWHSSIVTLGCTASVVLVGVVDYATGVDARVFPLYYLPIAIGSLRVSRAAGLGLALLSTTLWALAMWLAGSTWTSGIFIFNTATQVASLGLVAILVADVARRYDLERDLSRRDNLLDNFKIVNDEQGHLQGDMALREAAAVIQRAIRASDVAARLGGDEFAVLLPDTGPETALSVLERLDTLLASEMGRRQWPVTASIGALSFLKAPATVQEALAGADSLMYRVKQAGKGHMLLEVVDVKEPAVRA